MVALPTRSENLKRIGKLSDEELETLAEAVEMGLVDQYVPADDQLVAIANGNLQAIAEYVRESRDKWMLNFARGLSASRNLVDQREVDERRGYWWGAYYMTHILPKYARKKVARAANSKESGS